MATLDKETLRLWNQAQIDAAIRERGRQIRDLIREELEQTEFFNGATLEFDVKSLLDRDERIIRELRDEIYQLRHVH